MGFHSGLAVEEQDRQVDERDREHGRVEPHRAEELAHHDLEVGDGDVRSSSIVPDRFSSE